jgi:hypothetical protein
MRLTKLNHLLGTRDRLGRCPDGKQHYWIASGEVRATAGNNIAVHMRCNNCTARETVWLTTNEYRTQERIINNSLDEQNRNF